MQKKNFRIKNHIGFLVCLGMLLGCSSVGSSSNDEYPSGVSDLGSFGNEDDVSVSPFSASSTFETCQIKELLIGKWYSYAETDSSDNFSYRDNYFTFNQDGTFEGTFYKYQDNDRFRLEGTYGVTSNRILLVSYDITLISSSDSDITDHIEKKIAMDLSWNSLDIDFSDTLSYSLKKIPDDSSSDLELTEIDGICDDQYITTCPSNDIFGQWDVAAFYAGLPNGFFSVNLTDNFGADDFYVKNGGYVIFAESAEDFSGSHSYNTSVSSCKDDDCNPREWVMVFSSLDAASEANQEEVRFTISNDILAFKTTDDSLTTVVLQKTVDDTASGDPSCE